MRILALDSSSPLLSVALVEDGRVLSESLHEAKAGDLLPAVLGPLDGVEAIAVGLGPGSFTGLRVGLAAAKALAYAKGWPIAGASSLLALARGAHAAPLVCATLEARRGELFASLHRGDELVWPEAVYRAEALAEKLRGSGALVVGPGALANRAALEGLGIASEPRAPSAAQVALLCEPALRGQRFDAAACFSLAPTYLQPATAEVALAEGRVGGLSRRT